MTEAKDESKTKIEIMEREKLSCEHMGRKPAWINHYIDRIKDGALFAI